MSDQSSALEQVFSVLDTLSQDELAQLQARLTQKRIEAAQLGEEDALLVLLQATLAQAEPVVIVPGTMNVARLRVALDSLREGLSEADWHAIDQAIRGADLE